jgi:hypothetical protein
MKSPSHMRNLTLASAKHLLSQGHITPAHHAKIIAAASIPKMLTMPKMPAGPFGALAKKPAVPPPVPAGMPGAPAAVPGVSGAMGNVLPPGFMADES